MKAISENNISCLVSILNTKTKRYRNKAPEVFNKKKEISRHIKRSLTEERQVTVEEDHRIRKDCQITLLLLGLGHCTIMTSY